MKPERRSELLLGVTRSKAKMFEYNVPLEHHIDIVRDPAHLFSLSIGLLGDLASLINSGEGEQLDVLKTQLRFSAQFFDAYCQGRFQQEIEAYLLLIGSASYYLSDLPGSASVLAQRLPGNMPDLGCSGLDGLSAWLLKGNFNAVYDCGASVFREEINSIAAWTRDYARAGNREAGLDEFADALRMAAYRNGSARELLFADIAAAVARKRREYSSWYSLPRYSDQPVAAWEDSLRKASFVRELWPAQRLIGEKGFLKGASGILQMPTSAGKTRATELVIRSAFLAGKADLAVMVAPFRALCHEIRNALVESFKGEPVSVDELTDVFQPDFDIEELLLTDDKQVLVVTPEKLVYVLRHNPELAGRIGLLIYDEGHLFDNGARGVTYELLVTSLKSLVPREVQTVLVSAVMNNAEAINEWLNGPESVVATGANLAPTYRSIAFASWQDFLGRLQFVNADDPDSDDFFVPRVIETISLNKKPRERNTRYFPVKGDGTAVALYLGVKLCPSGSVAIFCGRKSTVTGLCEMADDVFGRAPPLEQPANYSDRAEVKRLAYLHERNIGSEAPATRAAKLGIFAHHNNTPHGIRLAIEHAMRRGAVRMVICTSTLAQGVNLPIRYLIVTSTQQGSERIKVRDFHNLIGRAGRSGMHTEGSILFANPDLYDNRAVRNEAWRWTAVKRLLQPQNAEPCASALLSVFKPLESDDGKYTINLEPSDLLDACIGERSELLDFVDGIVARHSDKAFSEGGLRYQIEEKWKIITALESYLMAYWEESTEVDPIEELATRTLAFHLAEENEQERDQLISLFKTLAGHIESKVPEVNRRKVFGRTLMGVQDAIEIETWVTANADSLIAAANEEGIFDLIWTTIVENIHNSVFRRCNQPTALTSLAIAWLNGVTFSELHTAIIASGARIGKGKRPRVPTIENVIDICENGLAFDGMLAVGAIAELFEHLHPEETATAESLRSLQKRIKYGLGSPEQVAMYEVGFSDRVVAIELSGIVARVVTRGNARQEFERERNSIEIALARYPSYYQELFARILG